MKRSLIAGSVLLGSLVAAPAFASNCSDLAGLASDKVQIFRAEAQKAQVLPPDPVSAMTGGSPTEVAVGAHCLVEGKIEDREGVNGR